MHGNRKSMSKNQNESINERAKGAGPSTERKRQQTKKKERVDVSNTKQIAAMKRRRHRTRQTRSRTLGSFSFFFVSLDSPQNFVFVRFRFVCCRPSGHQRASLPTSKNFDPIYGVTAILLMSSSFSTHLDLDGYVFELDSRRPQGPPCPRLETR